MSPSLIIIGYNFFFHCCNVSRFASDVKHLHFLVELLTVLPEEVRQIVIPHDQLTDRGDLNCWLQGACGCGRFNISVLQSAV